MEPAVERMEQGLSCSDLLLRSGKRVPLSPGIATRTCKRGNQQEQSLLWLLPEELLENILLSTSSWEDLCGISCVCKRFRGLAVSHNPGPK